MSTLGSPKIVVLGGAVMDLYFRVPELPSWNQAVQATRYTAWPGGKGLNQAIAASRLGARTSLISAVGNDEFGARAIEALELNNVSHELVAKVEGTKTDVAAVFVQSRSGESAFVGWKSVLLTEVNRHLVRRAEELI